jgi:hypothetical protein
MAQLKVPSQFSSMRRSDILLTRESRFLDTKIFRFLRENYRDPRDRARRPGLDLSGVGTVGADFSDLDLTDFNIAGAIFDTVDFSNAIINPKGRVRVIAANTGTPEFSAEYPDFRGSTWWDARYIEPSLLLFLADWYFPSQPNVRYPIGYSITQERYEGKVRALCKLVNVLCPTTLKFGEVQNQAGAPQERPGN